MVDKIKTTTEVEFYTREKLFNMIHEIAKDIGETKDVESLSIADAIIEALNGVAMLRYDIAVKVQAGRQAARDE